MLSEKEPIICNQRALYFQASVYMARFDEKKTSCLFGFDQEEYICLVETTNINNRHRDEVVQLVHLILFLVKNLNHVQI